MLSYCFCNGSSSVVHQDIDLEKGFLNHFDFYSTFHKDPVRKVAFRYSGDVYLEEGNHFCLKAVQSIDQLLVGAELGLVDPALPCTKHRASEKEDRQRC